MKKVKKQLMVFLNLHKKVKCLEHTKLLVNLIKSVSDATDKLIDLQKKLKDVNQEDPKKGPTNVTNALFVGSTADLAKLIKGEQKSSKKD